jgi:hypothetical protein
MSLLARRRRMVWSRAAFRAVNHAEPVTRECTGWPEWAECRARRFGSRLDERSRDRPFPSMRTPLCLLAAALFALSPAALLAQPNAAITPQETAARREALAARIDSGVVIAFGGRALVHDFSTFYQLPAFRYLTELNEPDAALVMVVRNKRARSTLFLTPLDARTAFYYGVRVDSTTSMSAYGMPGRSASALPAFLDSLAATGLPFYHVPDVETMDFARNDTLTRGQEALKGLAKRFPTLTVRNGMPLVLQVRVSTSCAPHWSTSSHGAVPNGPPTDRSLARASTAPRCTT